MKYDELHELGNENAVKVGDIHDVPVLSSRVVWYCTRCAHAPARLCADPVHVVTAQAAGKYRQEGKNYTVNDGDVRSGPVICEL